MSIICREETTIGRPLFPAGDGDPLDFEGAVEQDRLVRQDVKAVSPGGGSNPTPPGRA